MELKKVVMKLIGDIKPVGASHIDAERFVNLTNLCELVNELVVEIDKVHSDNKDRNEHSVKVAGEYASNFLTNTLGITD